MKMRGIKPIAVACTVACGILEFPATTAADTPKSPMVSASKAPAASPVMFKMLVDSMLHTKVTGIAVTTRNTKVGGEEYVILSKPLTSAHTVKFTYRGEPGTLIGWEAVHFLINGGYFKWQEVGGKRIGLVPTSVLNDFGPGVTLATLDGSNGGTSGAEAPSGTGDAGSGHDDTTGTTRTSTAAARGGSGDGGGSSSGGGSSGGGSGGDDSTTGGSDGGGGEAVFSCKVELSVSALGGVAAEKGAYKECMDKVAAKERECLNKAAGDSVRQRICKDTCNKVKVETCKPLGSGIDLTYSEGEKEK
ncbi:MAG: hypothetical protein PVG92_04490 [Holophagae bacterium]|jgi:hypothetical protein